MVRIDGKTVVYGTSCNLELSLVTADSTTKDDEGAHDTPISVKWSIKSDHFIGAGASTQMTYAQILQAFLSKTLVDAELMIARGADMGLPAEGWQPEWQINMDQTGYLIVGGEALLTSLSHNANVKGFTTFSLQLTGQGKLHPRSYFPAINPIDNPIND